MKKKLQNLSTVLKLHILLKYHWVFGSFFSRDVQDQKWCFTINNKDYYIHAGWDGIWHKKQVILRKGDIRVKVDRQGGKGVKQSAKGDETIEGWWWRSFVHTGQTFVTKPAMKRSLKLVLLQCVLLFLSPNHRFKGFFIHILIDGRPQFNKMSIYGPRKIAIY